MPADGYPNGLAIDGIPLRDRVWLSLALQPDGQPSPSRS
jgi:hypothetical protein